MNGENEVILNGTLENVMHNSMIPYAEYVILDRALPRVEDGLKPVQRRILYAMYDLGIMPDKPYKKSARVVGECLAKYHPHGDTSVYDAMVRLAQPFNMRMTLVDGQGNFGNIDGDGAAAMRYTEAKLDKLSLEMLSDLEKDTVDWQNNFDDSLKEPVTLPCRFPNLLVNGAMGIAVGLATNIPTHNLAEVIDGAIALIDNPKITLGEMMKYIKAPDFPTGGYLLADGELIKAYETGKGKLTVRAKINVEQENGKQIIVITEIPYQVNKSQLILKLGDLAENREDLKNAIADIIDESDRHGMRIAIKLKKDVDASSVLGELYKYSNLQATIPVNMVVIADGKPQQLGLIPIVRYYTEYQKKVVLRRTKYDLAKAKLRYEIVTGLVIAVTNIDKVVQIIKKSPDTPTARQNLRKEFNLSEVQAQAILDLKLARLTRLEVDSLKDELVQLEKTIAYLQSIIDSKRKLNSVVIDELTAIKKKYKDDRRTVIVKDFEDAVPSRFDDERPIENYVIGFSGKNLVRKVKVASYSRSNVEKPTNGELFRFMVNAKSNECVYAFTNFGNVYKILPDNLPECKGAGQGGITFKNLFKDALATENPVAFFTVGENLPEGKLIFFTKNGMVKVSEWSEYAISKQSAIALKLKDGDELINVEQDIDGYEMYFVTKKGMTLRANKELPVQLRLAGGVKGMEVADGDEVVYAEQVGEHKKNALFIVTSFGTFKRVGIEGNISRLKRACKGVKIADLGDAKMNEEIIFAKCVKLPVEGKVSILDRMGMMHYVNADKIPEDGRVSKGKILKDVGSCQPLEVYFPKQ